MRIVLNAVFLASDRFGGTWTYTSNLIRALSGVTGRHALTVIANGAMADRWSGLPVRVIPVSFPLFPTAARVLWEHTRMRSLIAELAPDVFHTTGNILPTGITCPTVLTVHDFQYHFYPENFSALKRSYLRFGMRSSVRRASTVLCVSQMTRNHAAQLCGADPSKLHVVHEAGVWPQEWEGQTPPDELRRQYRLDHPVILYTGSGFPHKNLVRLITAFRSIMEHHPHDLVIAGESFGKDPVLERLISSWSNEERRRIRLTGFIPRQDLLGLYSLAECYVFPSLFEGFGISMVEAMAAGCPVIASRVSAIPEVAGDAVLYCDPYDTASIADRLETLLRDPALRASYAQKGRMRASEYSWERTAERTMAVYEHAIERSHNGTIKREG